MSDNVATGTAVKTPMREVRLRVAACFAFIMLSSDSLNPVKVLSSIIGVDSFWFACFFCAAFVGIILANSKELAYFSVKVFFHSILSIFFSSMEVLGRENIPVHGPVIFTGNHMNQFVDGAVLLVTNPRSVAFLIAEKSFKKRIIGDFARAVDSIPVARPQDKASAGPGTIHFDGLRILGQGTRFTELQKGDRLRPGRSSDSYKVKEVISDTEGLLAAEYGETSPLDENSCQRRRRSSSTASATPAGEERETLEEPSWVKYDILKHVDQGRMFDVVHSEIAKGRCLGIFPEGGSHDRTDLLPLKAGVAAIALGVKEKFDVNVPIIPIGFTYFRGHRFRGRVVAEYGSPIYISQEVYRTYQESKRQGYQALLKQIEDGMRNVIIAAPDYSELKLIHTTRRLYQRPEKHMSTRAKQDLARRFSVAYRILRRKFSLQHQQRMYAESASAESGKGVVAGAEKSVNSASCERENPLAGMPEDLLELLHALENYQQVLDHWGLKDYQLMRTNLELSYGKLLYTFLHGAVILLLASIPSVILNFPVGIAADYFARTQAKKDLQASRVKLKARDVLLSKKILFSLVAVPTLWVTYALLLLLFSPLEPRTVLVLFLCCPFFSYLGVTAVERGMVDVKDLRPAFLRLLPSFRREAPKLLDLRLEMSRKVREAVHKYGPSLGPIYFEQPGVWENLFLNGDRTDRDLSGDGQGTSDAAGRDAGESEGQGQGHVGRGEGLERGAEAKTGMQATGFGSRRVAGLGLLPHSASEMALSEVRELLRREINSEQPGGGPGGPGMDEGTEGGPGSALGNENSNRSGEIEDGEVEDRGSEKRVDLAARAEAAAEHEHAYSIASGLSAEIEEEPVSDKKKND